MEQTAFGHLNKINHFDFWLNIEGQSAL